jgi:hypothetical protein
MADIIDRSTWIGRRCLLTDARCKGMIATAESVRPDGMRMTGVGIVPHNEYRLATEAECAAWDGRQ